MKQVIIYTDGSSLKNPGSSGWAAVLTFNQHEKELSGGYKLSTNNRMEIMAAIMALESLKQPCKVALHTDSRYVIDGITKWITGWLKRDWVDAKKKPVKNKDLWQRLLTATQQHQIDWIHVKAHSGVELNERCDQLAKDAAKRDNLPEDEGYVK